MYLISKGDTNGLFIMLPAVTLILVIQVVCSLAVDRNYGHERVVTNINENYQKAQILVRPEANTTVDIGLTLAHITSFCDKTGLLKATYWLKQSWVDDRLSWEDTSVSDVRYPITGLWRPDLRDWMAVDYQENINLDIYPVIYSKGMVLWIPPAEFTTRCDPPETETDNEWLCSLKLGSWTYNSWAITPRFYNNNSMVDLDSYSAEKNGWQVTAEEGRIDTKYYDCCTEPYSAALFRMKISKIPGGIADQTSGALSSLASQQILGLMITLALLTARLV